MGLHGLAIVWKCGLWNRKKYNANNTLLRKSYWSRVDERESEEGEEENSNVVLQEWSNGAGPGNAADLLYNSVGPRMVVRGDHSACSKPPNDIGLRVAF